MALDGLPCCGGDRGRRSGASCTRRPLRRVAAGVAGGLLVVVCAVGCRAPEEVPPPLPPPADAVPLVLPNEPEIHARPWIRLDFTERRVVTPDDFDYAWPDPREEELARTRRMSDLWVREFFADVP